MAPNINQPKGERMTKYVVDLASDTYMEASDCVVVEASDEATEADILALARAKGSSLV